MSTPKEESRFFKDIEDSSLRVQEKYFGAAVNGWTQEYPRTLGDWWYWDGDRDHRPVAVDVHALWGEELFASGNHGYGDAVNVSILDGWWHPLKAPEIPEQT